MSQMALLVVGAVFGLVVLAALVVLVVWLVARTSSPSQAARPEQSGPPHA